MSDAPSTDVLRDRIEVHLRSLIDQDPVQIPVIDEIEALGQRHRRRQRGGLGVLTTLVLFLIVGVGVTIRESPEQDLAAGLDTPVAVAPFTFDVREDGSLIGLAWQGPEGEIRDGRSIDPASVVVLVTSDDATQWRPLAGSEFDLAGTGGVGRPQAVGFALRDATVVLATATVEPSQRTADADIGVLTATFDLDADGDEAKWTEIFAEAVVDVDATEVVVGTELVLGPEGALVQLTLFEDVTAQTLDDAGLDWTEVCGVSSETGTTLQVRRCGSTVLEEIAMGPVGRVPSTVVLYLDEAGLTVVRELASTTWWQNQLYQTDRGAGVVTDSFGETVNGASWVDVWGPIKGVSGAAAYGESRIALERLVPAPLGPNRPVRGLWISDSAALDEPRHHRVVAGESGTHIAADYGIALDDLIAANADIAPGDFADGVSLEAGTNLVIPDTDPDSRAWRSIDLRDVFGPDVMQSHWMFDEVAAGAAGYVATLRSVSTTRPSATSLLDTEAFVLDSLTGSIEGHTPFGPATVLDLDGQVVAAIDHLEVAHLGNPHQIVDGPDGPLISIEVTNELTMDFPADEWFQATRPPDQPETLLVGSPDGVEWRELGRFGLGDIAAVDDEAVYFVSWYGLGIERIVLDPGK